MQTRIRSASYNVLCLILSLTGIERSVAFLAQISRPSNSGLVAAIVHRQHQLGRFRLSIRASSSFLQDDQVVVALTREEGANDKLKAALLAATSSSLVVTEVPCIAHADGPDYFRLQATLEGNVWDYVTITSPEAARVLISVWKDCVFSSDSPPSVAAVGKATQEVLQQAGIPVSFCPSKATAATLVNELAFPPEQHSSPPRVLYPASARAAPTLQDGLTARGFEVTRLDTYDTVTAVWSPEQRQWASRAQIACFASPSAVQGWLQNASNDDDDNHSKTTAAATSVLAACIGETSARACREHGWSEENIFYPDLPGIPGWVQAVSEAAAVVRRQRVQEHV